MIFRHVVIGLDSPGVAKGLSGTGYGAIYDLKTKQIEWHQVSEEKMKQQVKMTNNLKKFQGVFRWYMLAGLIALGGMGSLASFDDTTFFHKISPIIFGLLLYPVFEAWLLHHFRNYPLASTIPPKDVQHRYFVEMERVSVKYNTGGGRANFKTPYLGSMIAFLGIIVFFLPISYHFYLTATSLKWVIIYFSCTVIVVFTVPCMLWNFIFKSFLYRKLISRTNPSRNTEC